MEDPFEEYRYDENADALLREAVEDYQRRNGYVVSEEDEDEDDEDEDEDDDDEQEEDEEDGEEEEHVPVEESPRASQDGPSTSNQEVIVLDEPENCVKEEGNKRRRIEVGEACSSLKIGSAESSQGNQWDRNDIEGLFCPICMDAWTNNGEHCICCLPCGHIYGMSCIKRWLQQRKNSGKCPQCNRKCTLKDVRKLYASQVVAVDEEAQKKIRSLEAKCATLESKDADWCKKEAGWQKREAELYLSVQKLTESNSYLERMLQEVQSRPSGLVNANGNCQWRSESEHNLGSKICGKGSYCNFELQKVFQLHGARVFDIDASNQILLIAQRRGGSGEHLLTKMSLIPPYDMEDILLPSNTNVIKDLHISPHDGSLALYASLGKKLSVVSTETNNLVVNYDLQSPAWSCSWDLNSSHYIYAGLQNGSVLVFDMRQTAGPMKSLNGLTSNPVHTVQSLPRDPSLSSGFHTVLSASAIGLCQWSISTERPYIVPETDNQGEGVCISLAYCPRSDDIVVSYRPKFDMSMDLPFSQPSLTPSQVSGQGIQGSHVSFERVGIDYFQKSVSTCANVSNMRLPKSVIIDIENHGRLFASEDEVTSELVLQELPSFSVLQHFKCPDHVRDLKYSPMLNRGLLGCLSVNSLQLFCPRLS